MDGGLTPQYGPAGTGATTRIPRWIWVMGALILVVAAAGWYLAWSWHGRATRAEDEYRDIAQRLTSREGDVSSLTDRQRDLSAEKAQIEDERAALTAEKQQLETNQAELHSALDVVQRIAVAYQACSSGYVDVIRDLDASQVTPQTQQNLDRANASCDDATALIRQLPPQ